MSQSGLFRLQQSLKIQTKRSQCADLQHATSRNSVTELLPASGLADDIEHDFFPCGRIARQEFNERIVDICDFYTLPNVSAKANADRPSFAIRKR